jgi:uncharacterized protein (DUF3084 family)
MADIMDKIVDGVNKGIAAVSSGSKYIIEQAKIKTKIKELENEKKELLQLLGNKILEMRSSNQINIEDAGVNNFFNEIAKRDEAIKVEQERLAELEKNKDSNPGGVVVCQCGNQNPVGSKFCSKCGSQI